MPRGVNPREPINLADDMITNIALRRKVSRELDGLLETEVARFLAGLGVISNDSVGDAEADAGEGDGEGGDHEAEYTPSASCSASGRDSVVRP